MINIVEDIKKNGYYILKNYYSEEFCNTIIKDINKIKQYNKGEGNDIRVPNFENNSKNTNKFLNEQYFITIGEKLLGHKPDRTKKRCQLGIVKYSSGKECSGGGWHVDNHNPQFKALLYL